MSTNSNRDVASAGSLSPDDSVTTSSKEGIASANTTSTGTSVVKISQTQIPGYGILALLYGRMVRLLAGNKVAVATWNVFVLSGIVTFVTIAAVFSYGAFYYLHMPQTMLSKPVYFQISQIIKERPEVDGSITKIIQEGLVGELVLEEDDHFVRTGQAYDVTMELDMPDSEVNHLAGTSMVLANFYDNKNNVLSSSSRLLMLKYRSWLLRTLDTLLYAPLYLFGFSDQNQVRKVQLFKGYTESSYRATSKLTVTIENPRLQIYNAHITMEAQLTGVRYCMHYWPISTGILVGSCFWFVIFIIVTTSWFTINPQKLPHDNQNYQTVLKSAPPTLAEESTTKQSTVEGDLAPTELHTSLNSTERTTIDVGGCTENTSLGVTPLDSTDMMKHEPNIRKRIHLTEQSST